jgi:hypothetical protein
MLLSNMSRRSGRRDNSLNVDTDLTKGDGSNAASVTPSVPVVSPSNEETTPLGLQKALCASLLWKAPHEDEDAKTNDKGKKEKIRKKNSDKPKIPNKPHDFCALLDRNSKSNGGVRGWIQICLFGVIKHEGVQVKDLQIKLFLFGLCGTHASLPGDFGKNIADKLSFAWGISDTSLRKTCFQQSNGDLDAVASFVKNSNLSGRGEDADVAEVLKALRESLKVKPKKGDMTIPISVLLDAKASAGFQKGWLSTLLLGDDSTAHKSPEKKLFLFALHGILSGVSGQHGSSVVERLAFAWGGHENTIRNHCCGDGSENAMIVFFNKIAKDRESSLSTAEESPGIVGADRPAFSTSTSDALGVSFNLTI